MIDWGDAWVGDPLADLARLSMSGPSVTTAFLDGYGIEATPRCRTPWPAIASCGTSARWYEHRAGGDWFDAYRDGIRADVGRLTG